VIPTLIIKGVEGLLAGWVVRRKKGYVFNYCERRWHLRIIETSEDLSERKSSRYV